MYFGIALCVWKEFSESASPTPFFPPHQSVHATIYIVSPFVIIIVFFKLSTDYWWWVNRANPMHFDNAL